MLFNSASFAFPVTMLYLCRTRLIHIVNFSFLFGAGMKLAGAYFSNTSSIDKPHLLLFMDEYYSCLHVIYRSSFTPMRVRNAIFCLLLAYRRSLPSPA
jgi:hypothetical protein